MPTQNKCIHHRRTEAKRHRRLRLTREIGDKRLAFEQLENRQLLAFGDLEASVFSSNPIPARSTGNNSQIAVDGFYAVASYPSAEVRGVIAGQAYVYNRSTGARIATLDNPAPSNNDFFGSAVAIDQGRIVVGVPGDNVNAGSVHVFDAASGALLRTLARPASAASTAQFGYAVDIEGDNILVGASRNTISSVSGVGSVYVYSVSTGSLLRTIDNPLPSNGDFFGEEVGLSGNLAVISAPREDTSVADAGQAYVFDISTGSLLSTLANPTPVSNEGFGFSVAIDGNLAFVGAPSEATVAPFSGAVYAFDTSTGSIQQSFFPTTQRGEFGYSLAADAGQLLVGARSDRTVAIGSGQAYLYNATTGAPNRTFANPNPFFDDRFGDSVALSSGYAAIQASLDNDRTLDTGAGYLFDLSTASSPPISVTNGNPSWGDLFATAVASDGSTIVVGAPAETVVFESGSTQSVISLGGAYVYNADGSPRFRLSTTRNNPSLSESFGDSVAVDGNRIVVGNRLRTIGTSALRGVVDVFDSSTGLKVLTINNPTTVNNDFGRSVTITSQYVVVGASQDGSNGLDAGVFVFDRNSGSLLTTIRNPSPAVGDQFGWSIAVSGNLLAVSAARKEVGAITDAGTVFVFALDSGTLVSTIPNPSPVASDWFGSAIALAGNRLAVAALQKDIGAVSNVGQVTIFDATSGQLTNTINDPTVVASDGFGTSVSLRGNYLAVGAQGEDVGVVNSGAAFVFNLQTNQLVGTVRDPSQGNLDLFGATVAFVGDNLLVGATQDDTRARDSGAAYLFEAIERTTAVWINPSGGDWMNPANWLDGVLPSATLPASIDVPGSPNIVVSSGEAVAASIISQEPIIVSGGTLTVAGVISASSGVALSGGVVRNATFSSNTTIQATAGSLEAVTIDGTVNMPNAHTAVDIRGGLTLNGQINASGFATGLKFYGSQTLGGTGQVVWGNSYGAVAMGANDVLTIGPNVTLTGFNFNLGGGTGLYGDLGTFVNYGTLEGNVPSGVLSLTGANWVNHGTVRSTNGNVFVTQYYSPQASWTNGPSGVIQIGGSAATIYGQNWNNQGSIELQSPITTNVTGTFVNSGGITLASGATFNVPNASATSFPTTSLIAGLGTVAGNITNAGTIEPGLNGTGTLTVNGNYTQTSSGRINAQIQTSSAGGFDQLRVLGTSTLAGTLEVREFGVPAIPSTVELAVVLANSRVGTFDTTDVNVPSAPNLQVNYTANAVQLSQTTNQPPVLTPISPQVIDEQTELSVLVSATDPDVPDDSIAYSLVNPPAGAIIDPITGEIRWTPTEAQGPASYSLTVRATDLAGAFDEDSFSVQVNEVNVAPTIPVIPQHTAYVGQEFSFTVVANDSDLPANVLSYSLANAPAGMQIDSSTGAITWTPSSSIPQGLYSFVVTATDNGAPALSASRTVEVSLRDPDALYVTNINDSGIGSLRQAILTANSRPGRDKIWFDIPGPSAGIFPGTQLPSITDPVEIDATTQPGYAGIPLVQISGHNAVGTYYGQPIYGLTLESGDTTVRGLLISRFAVGIYITGPGGNVVEANYLGSDGLFDHQIGNVTNLIIANSPNNLIGGATPQSRNIISAARDGGGMVITGNAATGNRVYGNYVGLSSDGTYLLPNRYHNIVIDNAPGNFIGGSEPGQGNVIGGANSGISVAGASSIGNVLAGNFIGYNSAETHSLNTGVGISLSNAVDTIIGGDTPDSGNRLGFTNTAIGISGGFGNRVLGNRIGVASDGRNFGNSFGITLSTTTNATIGGNTPGSANVIARNGYGIYALYDNNGSKIIGNTIGLLPDGLTAAPNGLGIIVQSGSNLTIGGTTSSEANTIGGNSFAGIGLYETTNIRIVGNNIGVASDGSTSVGNTRGIYATYATNGLQVGGTSIGERNVISGNAIGIEAEGSQGSGNRIQGNAIGTTRAGNASVSGSGTGITFTNGSGYLIGGADLGAGNVISGNSGNGVRMQGSTYNVTIQGNRIGTNESGTSSIGNGVYGITLLDTSSSILVGGVNELERNIVSGNVGGGINIWGPKPGTRVIGNYVGTDVTGTQAIPNQGFGGILLRTNQIEVGGSGPGEGNLISGNIGSGIEIFQTTNSLIYGNRIGTDLSGTQTLGNTGHGIQVNQETRTVTIGGPSTGQGNTIRFNGLDGVSYFDFYGSYTGILLRGNSIDNNGGFAFDLNANDVVDGSDVNDWDDGANRSLNAPTLTSAASGGSTIVAGSYLGAGGLALTIDFYASPSGDPSGYGEGRRYLGSGNIVTDSSGVGTFSVSLPVATSPGETISATASILDFYFTSEYSNAVTSVALNHAPTDIVLSNAIVSDQAALGTEVGTFSAVDQDTNDSHLFSLVPGTGDADNGDFVIVGNQLQTNSTIDYLTKNQYSIRVRATDQAGESIEKVFTVLVRYVIRPNNLFVDSLGNLIVNGTSVNDDIEISERSSMPGTFDVLFNRSVAVINGVTGIVKGKLRAGDDRFVLNSTRNSEIDGNDGSDFILGGEGIDFIAGGRGIDTLSGRGGDDTFENEFDFGRFDSVDGGVGFDTIEQNRDWHRFTNFTPANGIEGLTIINPNNGTSRVQGERVTGNFLDFSAITHVNGIPTLGGLGLDIRGLSGHDTLVGTSGDDTISGGEGDDTISGLAGNDTISGNSGNDFVDGGQGNDTIDGGTGVDTTLGGEGDDVFIANSSDHVNDNISGGLGTNAIRLNPERNQSDPIVLTSFTPANQIQQLQGGSRVSGTVESDTLDFSAVTAWTTGLQIDARDGDDQVIAPMGINGFTINGGAGQDTIFGSDFSDIIDGGLDDDIIDALAGDDRIRGGSGFNRMTGGAGSDTFFFHNIIEGTNDQQIVDFDAIDFLKFQWPVNQQLLYGTAPVYRRFVWNASTGVLYLPNGRQLTLSSGYDLLQNQLLFGNW